jgi:signal transduction histidine kinase
VEVVRDAVHDISPVLNPARVEVLGDVALAKANGVALHRVVTNLVVNALKYSPPDSLVNVSFTHEGEGRVQVVVADRGRGIDPADVSTIFDEFNRGRLAEPDGGTGLGLTSVRELVKQMRGTVDIDSTVGVGTVVTLDLPAGSVSPRDRVLTPVIKGA